MLVVFDLDGTLIDSVGDLAASASELATVLGGRSLDTAEVAAMVGDGAALLVRRALEAAGLHPTRLTRCRASSKSTSGGCSRRRWRMRASRKRSPRCRAARGSRC